MSLHGRRLRSISFDLPQAPPPSPVGNAGGMSVSHGWGIATEHFEQQPPPSPLPYPSIPGDAAKPERGWVRHLLAGLGVVAAGGRGGVQQEAPQLTVADAADESLQRYKESLGLGGGGKDLSDPNDPRGCIILSLTMETPGREPVTIDLAQPGSEATLKDQPFKIKEGANFTMVAAFKVQHNILSGLHYVQVVKRRGIRVSKDSQMIVSCSSLLLLLYLLLLLSSADRLSRAAMLPTPTGSLPT